MNPQKYVTSIKSQYRRSPTHPGPSDYTVSHNDLTNVMTFILLNIFDLKKKNSIDAGATIKICFNYFSVLYSYIKN